MISFSLVLSGGGLAYNCIRYGLRGMDSTYFRGSGAFYWTRFRYSARMCPIFASFIRTGAILRFRKDTAKFGPLLTYFIIVAKGRNSNCSFSLIPSCSFISFPTPPEISAYANTMRECLKKVFFFSAWLEMSKLCLKKLAAY